ncbi:MAG TPA: TlpA disulfide reductase family protein [Bacteroidales bacterium]|nr:TlpA disulfide reductase family protein [Bacteroidales bacterium]
MIKKFILFLITIIVVFGCKNNVAEISGTLMKPEAGSYIFLEELQPEQLKRIDSVIVSPEGNFTFEREVTKPSFYLLKISENNFLTMLLEPGDKIKMNTYFDSLSYPASLSGSKGTELMVEYNITLRKSIKKFSTLNSIYMDNINNPELASVVESLDSMAQGYLDEINTYTKNYIDNNLTSLVSLVALYQQIAPNVYVMNPSKDLSYFTKVDSSLTINYPENALVNTLHDQIMEMEQSLQTSTAETEEAGEGTEAPEITLPSPEGDTIKLSSTRGSVVLLDFWASWCLPCRKENPNLVKAYTKYHSKGFQIFQVSLDKTREAWIKGISDDQLGSWIHVSDVKYWNSVVVPLYMIESIPTNFLLDKEGRIIASNLRGEQLENKLSEIFK